MKIITSSEGWLFIAENLARKTSDHLTTKMDNQVIERYHEARLTRFIKIGSDIDELTPEIKHTREELSVIIKRIESAEREIAEEVEILKGLI